MGCIMRDRPLVLEIPELEQRLSNLQSQVERLWRKAETSIPPVEQRLASMADQYAEYLKRWAATVERHTQAVTQLEAYASEWRDASSQMRQETADRLHDLESTIEREWDTLKRMQDEPIRQLREQAESLTQVSVAMSNASQQGLERAEARFASFEREVHLRLNELTMELQSALADIRSRLDRQAPARDASSAWSLDDVTRLHGQLREGTRGTGEFPRTIDHPSSPDSRHLLSAVVDSEDAWRSLKDHVSPAAPSQSLVAGIPLKWAVTVLVLGIAVMLASVFGWKMQGQIKAAEELQRLNDLKVQTLMNDAARQSEELRQAAQKETATARQMAIRAQRIADVMTAPDLIRFNMAGALGASGQALFSRSRGLVISGSRLTPTINDVHEVWLLTPTTPVKAGSLEASEDGTFTLVAQLPPIPRRVVGVMVTREAAGNGDSPSGSAVLSSVVSQAAAPAETQQ